MSALPEVLAPQQDLPFKFLNFFTENDAARFAGRDAEIRTVLSGFSAGSTYVLYGPSGVGKSSLLHAGVIPRMKARGYTPVYFRVLTSPTRDLLDAVRQTLNVDATAESLPDLLAARSAESPIVLILDQFEEFFIRFDEEKKPLQREFAALLGRVVAQKASSVHLLFSLREDYYASLADLNPQLPDLLAHGMRLLPLTAFGARQAIIAPLSAAGVAYDGEVVKLLIDDLAQSDFDPVVLQILCTEVFKAAVARDPVEPCLTEGDFHEVGGSTGIFLRYVQSVTRGIGSEQALLVHSILDAMTTERGTKMALRVSDLAPDDPVAAAESSLYFKATRLQAEWVLRHLRDHSVVRSIDAAGEWYELLHDRLVKVIKSSLEEDPEFNKFRNAKRFVSEFTKSLMVTDPHNGNAPFQAKPGQLMSVQQLEDLVEPFESILRLTPSETDFVLRSHIVWQTSRIPHWFEELNRFPATNAISVPHRCLRATDATIRAGGAFAAGQLPDVPAETMASVLDVALTDGDAMARRRASETIARQDHPLDENRIRQALQSRSHRGNAIDLLAELVSLEKSIAGIGPLVEFQIRLRLRERVFHDARDAINRGGRVGAIAGACVGFGWSATIGLLLLVCARLTNESEDVVSSGVFGDEVLAVALIFAFCATIFGTFIGWRAGARFEKRRALASPADWLLLPMRGVFHAVLVTGGVLALIGTTKEVAELPDLPGDASLILTAVLAGIAIAMVVRRNLLSETKRLAAARSPGRRIAAAVFRLWPIILWVALCGVVLRWKDASWSLFAIAAFGTVAPLTLGDPLARWASRCVGPRRQTLQAIVWSTLIATVPLAALLLAFIARVPPHWRSVIGIMAVGTSYFCAVGGVTLGLLSRDEAPGRRRRWLRLAAGIACGLVVATAIHLFGPLASYLRTRTLAGGEEVAHTNVRLVTRRPLVHYYAARPSQQGPNVITVSVKLRDLGMIATSGVDGSAVAFRNTPTRTAVSTALESTDADGNLRYDVHIRNERLETTPPRLSPKQTVYAKYVLMRESPTRYTGRIVAQRPARDQFRWVVDVAIPTVGYGPGSSKWFCTDAGRDLRPGEIAAHRWQLAAAVKMCEFPFEFRHPITVPIDGNIDLPIAIDRGADIFKLREFEYDNRPARWWVERPPSIEIIVALTARPMTVDDLLKQVAIEFEYLARMATAPPEADRNAALDTLKECVLHDPRNFSIRLQYAERLLEHGRGEEAVLAAEAALALHPEASSAWDVLAHAAYETKRWSRALEAWAAAERLGYDFLLDRCTPLDQVLRRSARENMASASASAPPR